jgi:hypothetical protein
MHKIYHIYVKDNCIMHSISEEQFETTWNTLNKLVGIMHTDYTPNDLSYEELTVNREFSLNSSY